MDDEGAIEGSVTIELTGHLADFYKEDMDEESAAEREKSVVDMVKGRIIDTVEVENVTIENIDDREKPLIYTFRIKVPAYAERTGKRLILRPSVSAHRTKSLFESGSRRNDIFFNYPWSETDEVTVELPPGYSVETSDPPKPVSDSRNLGYHVTEIIFDKASGTLSYKRDVSFGRNGNLEFGVQAYSGLKALFDSYHKADQHAVTLLKN